MNARYLLVLACLGWTAIPSPAGEPFAQGKPLSYWLLLLREGELHVESSGPWESKIGPGTFRASRALKSMGAEARSAVPALLAWFREGGDATVADRVKAGYLVEALRDVGCTDRSLVPLLRGLAALGDAQLTAIVAQALEPIDPELAADLRRQQRKAEVAPLLAAFKSSEMRFEQFKLLAELARVDSEQARTGLPFLRELLLDPLAGRSSYRADALDPTPILLQMGTAAREAAPLLEYRARQEGRASFAVALAAVAPEKVPSFLRKEPIAFRKEVGHLLSNSNHLHAALVPLFAELVEERSASLDTAVALVKLDPSKAKKTIPQFVEALNDFDPEAQLRAAVALPRVDPSRNKDVAAVLRSILKEYDGPTRERARELLLLMGKEAIPATLDLLDDPRWWHVVLDGLPRFGSGAKEAIPTLQKLLSHKDRGRSIRAAWALAWIDPDSLKSAIPGLLDAVGDSSAFVRELALLTLGKIGGLDQRVIAVLVGKLGSKTPPDEVIAAVHGLRSLGKDAVKPLVDRLADPDLQARCNAAWVLAEIGPPAKAALPALRKLVADKEAIARIRVIYAMARIDPTLDLNVRNSDLWGDLLTTMYHDDRNGREAAIAVGRLASDRKLAREINEALSSPRTPSIGAATNAALALRIRGPKAALRPASVATTLAVALKPHQEKELTPDQVHWYRTRLVLLLREAAELGPEAFEAIPAVLGLWKHEELRGEVEAALASLGSPDRDAIPELKKLLNDPPLRARTVALLPKLGPAVKELLAELKTIHEFDVVDNVVAPGDAVLGRVRAGIRPEWLPLPNSSLLQPRPHDVELVQRAGKTVIPELIKLLEDKSPSVRTGAIHALGLAGPAAKEAAPRLLAMLAKESGTQRFMILVSLSQMRGDGITDIDLRTAMMPMLKVRENFVRDWTIRRLGEMGATAKVAVPELVQFANGRNKASDDVCLAAIEALGKIGATDEPTLRALSSVLEPQKRRDKKLVLAAIAALGKIGPAAKSVFPSAEQLMRLDLEWKDYYRSEIKLVVLASICVDPKRTKDEVKLLAERIQSGYRGAGEILAAIGPEARSAVPDLIAAYRDSKSQGLREEILESLSILGPENKEMISTLAANVRNDPESAAILGAFASQAKSTVPKLIEGLQAHAKEFKPATAKAGEQWKGTNYINALAAIGPDARAAVPELLKLHEHWRKEPFVYLRIASALKKIDPDAARKAGIP